MPSFENRRIASRIIFIIGLFLVFLGSTFLASSPPEVSRMLVLASFLIIAVGIGCAFAAIGLNRRPLYLFFAAFLLQAGLFFFLGATGVIPISFLRSWPLLSVFAGVAILPAGWQRYRKLRVSYIVLSISFIVLGCVLMFFSLDMVDFSFSQFVLGWWPLLILLAGLVLVLAALSSKRGGSGK